MSVYTIPSVPWDIPIVPSAGGGGGVDEFNVMDFGATGDGSTNDTAAIQAAVDAAWAAGGGIVVFPRPSVYYKCTGILDFSSYENIIFRGSGGRSELKDDDAGCPIVYTGTASIFIKVAHSRGLLFEGLDIRYSSGSFTGDLLSSVSASGAVGYDLQALRCTFSSTVDTTHSGRAGVHLDGMVRGKIRDCAFYWMDYGIIGYSADVSALGFSTDAETMGNWYNELDICGVANPDKAWSILRETFEPTATGGAGGIHCGILLGGKAEGLLAWGNEYWDVTTGSGAWDILYGYGFVIGGFYANLGNAATLFKVGSTSDGICIIGGRATGSSGAKFFDGNGQALSKYFYNGTTSIDSGITVESGMGTVTGVSQSFAIVTAPIVKGGGATGSKVDGTGSGTGPTNSVLGNQVGGTVIVVPGTSPSASANVVAVAWANLWPAIPAAVNLTPANAAAAALSGNAAVYEDRSQRTTDRFFLKVGSTALIAGTTYEWTFEVVGA